MENAKFEFHERYTVMRWVRLVILFFLSACAGFLHSQNQAQQTSSNDAPDSAVRRFEIGGQYTDFVLGAAGQTGASLSAFGPGFALNLNRHLALDASYSVMELPSCLFTGCSGGRESVFIAGARAEAREKHYGIFAYGRPGVVHRNASTLIEPVPGFTTTTVNLPGSSQFVSDVGGGVEYFVSSRVHAKVELGDLLQFQTCASCSTWTNHVQFSTGVYAVIGKPLSGKSFDVDEGEWPHRFFDKTNLLLFGASLLGQSADAITSQRNRSHGSEETDPLARPFVDQGWGGQIGLGVIENTAQFFVMYRLHKMGHHRIERLVPLVSGFVGGNQGYHNLQHQ